MRGKLKVLVSSKILDWVDIKGSDFNCANTMCDTCPLMSEEEGQRIAGEYDNMNIKDKAIVFVKVCNDSDWICR